MILVGHFNRESRGLTEIVLTIVHRTRLMDVVGSCMMTKSIRV